jgi:hypothetical protein
MSNRRTIIALTFSLLVVSASPATMAAGKPRPEVWPTANAPILESYPQVKETIYLNFAGKKGGFVPYSRKTHGRKTFMVPLLGMFSGSSDDLYLKFKIVSDLKVPGLGATKISSNNAGHYLMFSIGESQTALKRKPLTFSASDGKSELNYACHITWNPQNRTLTAVPASSN